MEIPYTSDFKGNYTLTFYARKTIYDSVEPLNTTENFTDFTQCVLRAKELMSQERYRLEGRCFPSFNCLIEWKNSDTDRGCLRCDHSLSGYNFKRCLGKEIEEEHLWKLNDIWEGRY